MKGNPSKIPDPPIFPAHADTVGESFEANWCGASREIAARLSCTGIAIIPFFPHRSLGKYDRLGCSDERSCLLSCSDI
jgi:hypothetical protein